MKYSKKTVGVLCSIIATSLFMSCGVDKGKATNPNDINSINFIDFSKEISEDRMYSTIEKLSSKDDARITGFDGEKDAASYICDEFRNIGLDVEEQEFPIKAFKCSKVEFTINSPENKKVESKSLTFSKESPKEGLEAEVVYGLMGTKSDLEKANVKDKIVLIKRGQDTFYNNTERAASLGAVGIIYFNAENNDILSGTLTRQSAIPAISISKTDSEEIISNINSGTKIKATLKVDSECKDSKSKNIIGTLKSKNKDAKTIVVGAHYDGVDTPAANDNASGLSTIIECARILSKQKLDCNIKFIAFGAEETGLIGSTYYVHSLKSDDLKNTIAMLNADMVGIGEKLCVYTANKSKKSLTADLAVNCMNQFKYENKRDESNRSDHAPFEAVNIPVAYFEYGPYLNYHTDEDTSDKIEKTKLSNTCNVITSVTNAISKNQEMFFKK